MSKRSENNNDDRRLIDVGYRYALSLTHHPQDAEDLIQQASMQVLQKKGRLVGRNYLFASIRNLYIDEYRKIRRRRTDRSDDEGVIDPATPHPEDVERRLDLHAILGCLQPEEREALFLNSVEGYTAEEISQLTGQPRGTVLSHLSRAKRRVRDRHNADEIMETK